MNILTSFSIRAESFEKIRLTRRSFKILVKMGLGLNVLNSMSK